MARGRAGTAIKKSWDARRIGRALAHQGADLRHWVSYATVAAVDDAGEVDLSNPNVIVITPGGIDVDVVLEPSGYPMTCRYGQAAAGFFICGPIKVGDQVVVGIPDGDPSMVGKILVVTSAPDGSVVPVGDDDLPLFKNDRHLIFAKGVPIDLRTDGGARLLINPDGTIQVGDGADEQMILGTTYRSSQETLDKGMVALMQTAAIACHGATNPATTMAAVQALATMLDSTVALLNDFEGQAESFLSEKNKVAK